MDVNQAKQILGIEENVSIKNLEEVYSRRRASLLSKSFNGEDTSDEISLLEEAFRILSEDLNFGTSVSIPGAVSAYESGVVSNLPVTLPGQDSGSYYSCPNCGKTYPVGVLQCDNCGTQIGRNCPSCGSIVMRGEKICKRCGVPVEQYDKQRFVKILSAEQKRDTERQQVLDNVKALDEKNKNYVIKGFLIIAVILLLIIGIIFLAVTIYYSNY